MLVKTIGVGVAGILLLGLVGCSGGGDSTATPTPEVSASTAPTATAEPVARLTDAELAGVFTGLQFSPDQFAGTSDLLDSVYPGLTTSDLGCLSPFGVGWDTDAALTDAAVEFGTSTDRSMTAVISSTGDADLAATLVADAVEALELCASGTDVFAMQGMEVQTQVEQTDADLTGADEAVSFRVVGSVGGASFTLVGMTARVGGNVVALVGWDPATNEEFVPAATQMFVDRL